MMTLLPRPDPRNEHCPFCNAFNSLITTRSYSAPMDDGTFRNADCIECLKCLKGFFVGWVSVQTDGIIIMPMQGL